MRPQAGDRTSEIQNSLSRLDAGIIELRSTLTAHDHTLEQIARETGSSAQVVREVQNNLSELQLALNGETRMVRELLLQISARLEGLDQRIARLEGGSDHLVGGVDERLKSMSQQVTTAVGAIVGIIAVAAILILLLK